MGTPVEITQDRFRNVYPNVTKAWRKVVANGPGCVGSPCDPPEHQIGWGADRLTYFLKPRNGRRRSCATTRTCTSPTPSSTSRS